MLKRRQKRFKKQKKKLIKRNNLTRRYNDCSQFVQTKYYCIQYTFK